jgi:hypothetical protein
MNLVIHLVHGTWPRGFFPAARVLATSAAAGVIVLIAMLAGIQYIYVFILVCFLCVVVFRMARSEGAGMPPWFESDSTFGTTLRRTLEPLGDVIIVTCNWSGRNSVYARESAADRLASNVKDFQAQFPGYHHVVIAHSHGGNVALRCLRKLAAGQQIRAVVTIGTPFLEMENMLENESNILTFSSLFMWTTLFVSCVILAGIREQLVTGSLISYIIYIYKINRYDLAYKRYGQVFWVTLFVSYFFRSKLRNLFHSLTLKYASYAGRIVDVSSSSRQMPSSPSPTQFLAIRAVGDEASIGLAVSSFAGWFSRRQWDILVKLHHFEKPNKSNTFIYNISYNIIYIIVKFFYFLFGITYGFIVIPLCCLFSSVVYLPFGRELILVAPAVNAFAETVPVGNDFQIRMLAKPSGHKSLRHSLPEVGEVQISVAGWIASLEPSGHRVSPEMIE